jgi:hypothetical protein
MADQLSFDVVVNDKGTAALKSVGTAATESAAKITAANIKVEKSTIAVGTAEKKYGADSLQAREATSKLTLAQVNLDKSMNKTQTSTEESSKGISKFGAVAGIAGVSAVEALVEFGKQSVEAYSEAQESQDKLADSYKRFPALADVSLSSLQNLNSALSEKTKYDDDATASGESVLAGFKVTGTQLTTLVPLLQDYASKTGKDLPTAATTLGKAINGQGAALKKVGINFKDTGSETGNFTELQQQLNAQVGGFAEDEGKSAAGQAQILANQYGEVQEAVGQELLPVLIKLGSTLIDVANFTQNNSKILVPIVGVLGSLAAAIIAVNFASKIFEASTEAWETVSGAVEAFTGKAVAAEVAMEGDTAAAAAESGALGKLGISAAGVGAAFAVIGTAVVATGLAAYVGRTETAKVGTDKLSDALLQLGKDGQLGQAGLDLFGHSGFRGDVNSSTQALDDFGQAAEGALGTSLNQKIGRIQSLGSRTAAFTTQTNQLDKSFASLVAGGNIDAAVAAYNKFIAAGTKAGAPLDALQAKFPLYNAAVKAAAGGQTQAAAAAAVLGKGLDKTSESAAAATLTQKDLNDALTKYANAALGARGDARSYQQAIDDATKSVKDNGKNLDITTAKGRNNQAALDAIASSGLKLAADTPKGANAQTYFAQTIDTTRKRLITAAEKMGDTRGQANKLASSILGVPKAKSIRFTEPGMSGALNNTASLRARIAALPSRKVITVTTLFYQKGASPGSFGNGLGVYRERGGPVKANQAYVVGEKRAELFVPDSDGTILPDVPTRHDGAGTARVAAGGGRSSGGTQVFTLQLNSSGSKVDDFLVELIRKSVRVKGGGNVQVALGRS